MAVLVVQSLPDSSKLAFHMCNLCCLKFTANTRYTCLQHELEATITHNLRELTHAQQRGAYEGGTSSRRSFFRAPNLLSHMHILRGPGGELHACTHPPYCMPLLGLQGPLSAPSLDGDDTRRPCPLAHHLAREAGGSGKGTRQPTTRHSWARGGLGSSCPISAAQSKSHLPTPRPSTN